MGLTRVRKGRPSWAPEIASPASITSPVASHAARFSGDVARCCSVSIGPRAGKGSLACHRRLPFLLAVSARADPYSRLDAAKIQLTTVLCTDKVRLNACQ